MFSNFRLINKEELEKVNFVLGTRFGNKNLIDSGSCDESNDGKKYHVTLVDNNPYKAEALLKNIGRVIKNVLGADKVYCSGKQIA